MSGKEHVNILLFNKWVTDKIQVKDLGLQKVISLKSAVIPITSGRHVRQRFKKAEVNIVERLANKMMHFGKRYAKNTGRMGGKKAKMLTVIRTALFICRQEKIR
jgi:small subunit ribosomal protein S7